MSGSSKIFRQRTGLRFRTSLAFALLAFVLSMTLAVLTFFLARAYLMPIREAAARREAQANAALIDGLIAGASDDSAGVLEVFSQEIDSEIVVVIDKAAIASSISVGPTSVPSRVRLEVESGSSATQSTEVSGRSIYVVGEPLVAAGGQYYEFFSFRELDRTLSNLFLISLLAASLTTVAGAGVGFLVSRRIIRPLRIVSQAAAHIADGDLGTRLPLSGDRDLDPLVAAFNEMSTSLERRIERELRFSSEVSHELRTPLTAISNSIAMIDARKSEMSDESNVALRILAVQVANMQRLVLDLLELARLELSSPSSALEPLDLVHFIAAVIARREQTPTLDSSAPALWVIGDRERIERVISNLLDNADRYAGGAEAIRLWREGERVMFAVDDSGPGIDRFERGLIFDRFSRGSAPIVQHTDQRATGLGLALVREHLILMDGTIEVMDSPEGGARFVVGLPAQRDS
jgi:signal transduction histidine kinase